MVTENSRLKAYVGTYTNGESQGIYSFTFNLSSEKIENIKLEAKLDNPTYLTITSDNKFLYSVIKEGAAGGAAAFEINGEQLKSINNQLAEGSSPCHVSLDKANKYLFTANYHKGEATVYPINEDGSLTEASALVRHDGSGPNKARQDKPYAHYSTLTPDEKYLCVIDLGIDKLMIYSVGNGKLEKHKELSLKPGCGPRHMAFHPNEKYAYILTELSAEIVALQYDNKEGSFSIIEYVPTLPADFTEENTASAIHLSPDGKFLYASNRGHDSIAVFSIDNSTGKLQFVAHTSTEGSAPRDFAITPEGDYLIAANQFSSNLVPFSIDKATGKLTRTGDVVSLPNPVCIKFLSL
jgi:6-phosphogluconolactonase